MSVREQYARAVEVLRDGGVVALPTDTVFGLCAVAADTPAVERVYEIKGRDPSQPLPLFVGSVEQARLIVNWNDTADALAAKFWPGALTIVVPRNIAYVTRAAAGGDTLGVRAPQDPALREMAAQLGPLTATSANVAGRDECRTAAEVRDQLDGAPDLIVDAPIDASGQPSTIVDCTDPGRVRLLREGGISRPRIVEALAGLAGVD